MISPGARLRLAHAINLFGHAAPPLAALITAPMLAQALGANDRGLVAAVTSPVLLLAALASFGLPDVMTVVIGRSRLLSRVALSRAFVVALCLSLALGVAVMAVVYVTQPSAVALLFSIALPSIPLLGVVALARGAAIGNRSWTLVGSERVIGAAARLAPIWVLFARDELSVAIAVAILSYGPAVGGLAYIFLFRQLPSRGQTPAGGEPESSTVSYNSLINFGGRLWIGTVAGVLLSRADQALFVTVGGTLSALGVYAVAVALGEIPAVANQAIRELILSREAERSDDDRLMTVSRLSFAFSVCLGLIIALALPVGVPALFGASFEGAVLPTVILLAAAAIAAPGTIAGTRLTAHGYPGLRSTSLLVALVINIGLVFALVPPLGAIGAALATLGANLAGMSLNIYFVRRSWRTPIFAYFIPQRSDLALLRSVRSRDRRHR